MKNQKGFSLAEVLVVGTIICIIAAITIASINDRNEAKRRAATKELADLAEKHIGLILGRDVDQSKPPAQWLSASEKAIARPTIEKQLAFICECPDQALELVQKYQADLLALPDTTDTDQLNKRLKLASELNRMAKYFQEVDGDNGKSCAEARRIIKTLDLLGPTKTP